MRNKIFGILAVASVMVACSNDETLSVVSSEPITFGNTFVENSTRAIADSTYGGGINSLTKFNVYGTVKGNEGNAGTVNIYNGDEVIGTVGESTWSCTKVQYWVPNCTYNFMALVDATVSDSDDNGMPKVLTYDVTSQKDLLIADRYEISQDETVDAKVVAFTFRHLLSKVQFEFTNNFPDNSGVQLKVKDLKITNAPQIGTYTIGSNNDSWEISDSGSDVEIDFGDETEWFPKEPETGTPATTSSKYARVLIPGTYTFDISFLVEHNKGGSDTEKTFTTGVVTLEPGKSYNFTATLSANNVSGVQPITFNIREDDNWDSQDKNVDY